MLHFSGPENYLSALPEWVPEAARHYLLHTVEGVSIRELARVHDCHASTILRQIRRFENRRDDPLVDHGLARLEALAGQARAAEDASLPSPEHLEVECLRVMRRLCETGAVLAVGDGMDRAVVVRDTDDGASARTAVMAVEVAEAMALRGCIECTAIGRISRYRITQTGRQELTRIMGRAEQREFAEAQATFRPQRSDPGAGQGTQRRPRYSLAESPLLGLARRRDRDGQAFLGSDLVAAGERLREDFELAQMEPNLAQDWTRFLAPGASPSGGGNDASRGPAAARARVALALRDLGPGLGDMALRCCCYLEGLEVAEKRMGWSARSGKIVLRIALQRLRRHYDEARDAPESLIG